MTIWTNHKQLDRFGKVEPAYMVSANVVVSIYSNFDREDRMFF